MKGGSRWSLGFEKEPIPVSQTKGDPFFLSHGFDRVVPPNRFRSVLRFVLGSYLDREPPKERKYKERRKKKKIANETRWNKKWSARAQRKTSTSRDLLLRPPLSLIPRHGTPRSSWLQEAWLDPFRRRARHHSRD